MVGGAGAQFRVFLISNRQSWQMQAVRVGRNLVTLGFPFDMELNIVVSWSPGPVMSWRSTRLDRPEGSSVALRMLCNCSFVKRGTITP